MSKRIKNVFRGQAASSIIYIILGLVLIIMPQKSLNLICTILGGGMLLMGVVHLVTYVRNREGGFFWDLLSGVGLLVLGFFLLMNPTVIVSLLPILLGLVILVDSFWTLSVCMEMKRLQFVRWSALLALTLLFIVLGVVMIVNPFAVATTMMMFIGVVFLLNGLVDVFFLLFLKKKDKILDNMAQNIIINTQEAERKGTVIDADVDTDGNVVETDVEYNVPLYETGEEDIIDVDPEDLKEI